MLKSRRGGRIAEQRERADETRAALLRTARLMFTRVGYQGARTEALAAEANVTQGSLYHHFDGKKALFEAVFGEVIKEARDQANARAVGSVGDLWSQVLVAFDSYLTLIAASEEFQKIVLIDGPAVLGWRRWRELQTEYVTSPITETLVRLMDSRVIARQPPEPLASLLQSALNDAALTIAHAPDPERTRSEMVHALATVWEGLRVAARLDH